MKQLSGDVTTTPSYVQDLAGLIKADTEDKTLLRGAVERLEVNVETAVYASDRVLNMDEVKIMINAATTFRDQLYRQFDKSDGQ
jgi:hypothetical protein